MAELPPSSRQRSMRDFDYFKEAPAFDGANQSDIDGLVAGKLKRTLVVHGMMTLLVIGAIASFAWDQRTLFAYHFSPPALEDLGKAEERDGQPWPQNAYVKLQGITENKGAHARFVRGMTLHQEYWYVHLIGSPVFIEVPADRSQGKVVEAFERVSLQGRLIELSGAREYQPITEFFATKLHTKMPERAYLLQAELLPDQAVRYSIAILVMLALPALNLFIWLRTYRRWRRMI